MTRHALVFIDHAQARIFHVDESDPQGAVLAPAPRPETRRTRRLGDGKREHGDRRFLEEVAANLKGNDEILVVGPGQAKNELIRHLEAHAKDVEKCVVGVETVDHPTDHQLVALARRRFKAIDLWR
jgi:stalled ribosome rescue protein Dom34